MQLEHELDEDEHLDKLDELEDVLLELQDNDEEHESEDDDDEDRQELLDEEEEELNRFDEDSKK